MGISNAGPERGSEPDLRLSAARRSRRHGGLLAALLGATLVVAACGASATSTTSPGSPGTAVAASSQVVGTPAAPGAGRQLADNGALQQLQQEYEAVVQHVAPSVVVIETSSGLGSGIILDTKGDIVTNAHVVGGATSFTVRSPTVASSRAPSWARSPPMTSRWSGSTRPTCSRRRSLIRAGSRWVRWSWRWATRSASRPVSPRAS